MMHTILNFFQCRWLISQNIAHFSTCKNPKFPNFNKTADVKSGESILNISDAFKYFTFGLVVLHYIHQENL